MTSHQIPPQHPPRVDGDAAFEWLDGQAQQWPHPAFIVLDVVLSFTFGMQSGGQRWRWRHG